MENVFLLNELRQEYTTIRTVSYELNLLDIERNEINFDGTTSRCAIIIKIMYDANKRFMFFKKKSKFSPFTSSYNSAI